MMTWKELLGNKYESSIRENLSNKAKTRIENSIQ